MFYSSNSNVFSSIIWRFSERFLATFVSFFVSVILARIIAPENYGIISLTSIFITFANVFVSDSFGKALIQKKEVTNEDYSTVFYFNFCFSILLYLIIFLVAPYISAYFEMPLLSSTLRVLALRLPLSSLNSIQHAYVSKNMLFKRFFWSTLFGTILSGLVGVIMAVNGYGVWALVAQNLSNSAIDTLVLWFTVKWRPIFCFKYNRLKKCLSLGSSILTTSILNSFYDNFRSLIIGTKFTSADLAYYTKGIHYPSLIITNVNTSIGSVMYPAFSGEQKNKIKLKKMLRKSISLSTFIIFPMMIGLAVVAEEFIVLLLTDSWINSVLFLQIGCIYLSLYPINTINLQVLLALGEGKLYFKMNVVKKICGLILVLFSVRYGIYAIAASEIILSVISLFINISATKKKVDYRVRELIEDTAGNLVTSILMCLIVIILGNFLVQTNLSLLICLLLKVVVGFSSYILLNVIFGSRNLYQIKKILKK